MLLAAGVPPSAGTFVSTSVSVMLTARRRPTRAGLPWKRVLAPTFTSISLFREIPVASIDPSFSDVRLFIEIRNSGRRAEIGSVVTRNDPSTICRFTRRSSPDPVTLSRLCTAASAKKESRTPKGRQTARTLS